MPTYRVYAEITYLKYIGDYKGSDQDIAIERASESDLADIRLCSDCGYQTESDPTITDWIVEELDE